MKTKFEFFTIGVYDATEASFFQKLLDNRIDTFCDIRQRRGVRGAQYSFVNSQRLQAKLADIGIQYAHITNLAPTQEIRELQYQADKQAGVLKRERQELGEVFKLAYKTQILNAFDFDDFLETLERAGAARIVFFCVEASPLACHRSIVTDALKKRGFVHITHL